MEERPSISVQIICLLGRQRAAHNKGASDGGADAGDGSDLGSNETSSGHQSFSPADVNLRVRAAPNTSDVCANEFTDRLCSHAAEKIEVESLQDACFSFPPRP